MADCNVGHAGARADERCDTPSRAEIGDRVTENQRLRCAGRVGVSPGRRDGPGPGLKTPDMCSATIRSGEGGAQPRRELIAHAGRREGRRLDAPVEVTNRCHGGALRVREFSDDPSAKADVAAQIPAATETLDNRRRPLAHWGQVRGACRNHAGCDPGASEQQGSGFSGQPWVSSFPQRRSPRGLRA